MTSNAGEVRVFTCELTGADLRAIASDMKVPLLDLAADNRAMLESTLKAVRTAATAGKFILGKPVEAFEEAARAYLGVEHAVATSSGSDALVCALSALGLGAGDEVITTPFSFFATVEAIVRVGARPRFVDIRADTYELDFESVEQAIGSRTRAILAVHLYGQPARVDRLRAIAERHRLALVEDAAQAFGARLHGKAAGSYGALGCYSFHPTKPLGAWGDAGLLVTDDASLGRRCRELRSHGMLEKHRHAAIGGNYRMDAIQALVLLEKLPYVSGWLEARRALATNYNEALSKICGLTTPAPVPGTESSAALYTLRVQAGRRDALADFLREGEVEVAVHYPVPLHRQPALLARGFGAEMGDLPEAERAAAEVLSLPLHPQLALEQQDYVIARVTAFFARSVRHQAPPSRAPRTPAPSGQDRGPCDG